MTAQTKSTQDNKALGKMIEALVQEQGDGGYVTIRTASKKLNAKQSDILDAVPPTVKAVPSLNGTLGEYRLMLEDTPVTYPEDPFRDDDGELDEENPTANEGGENLDSSSEGTGGLYIHITERPADEQDDIDPDREESEAPMSAPSAPESVVPAVEVPDAPVESGNPVVAASAPEDITTNVEREICIVCGQPIRISTTPTRGMCPRCTAQLSRDNKITVKAILAMPEEDFQALIDKTVSSRQELEDYKRSRTLMKEEFEARKDDLIPVKTLFEEGKAHGYGMGRVANAVGGDHFRHEPVGGFGSVWTPYFYGPRNAWYFDKEVLNHWDDLKRAPRPVAEKKARKPKVDSNGNPIPSTPKERGKGKAMTVVGAAAPIAPAPTGDKPTPDA